MPNSLLENPTSYKLKLFDNNTSLDHVPSEVFLKKIINEFNQSLPTNNMIYQGYRGQWFEDETQEVYLNKSEKIVREKEFEAVFNLDVFSEMQPEDIPNMNNGHVYLDDQVNRLIVLKENSDIIIGGVFFTINLKAKFATIKTLSIVESHRNKQLGSSLLQLSLLISYLYQVNYVEIASSYNAISLYTRHGFYLETTQKILDETVIKTYLNEGDGIDLTLNFSHPLSLQLFKKSLPSCLKTFVSSKRALDITALEEFMPPRKQAKHNEENNVFLYA